MEILSTFKWQITFLLALFLFFVFFRKEIAEFLREISWLKTKWFELRRIREEIFAKAEEVKILSEKLDVETGEIKRLESDIKELIRGYIETYAYDLSTRNILPPPQKVLEKANRELNSLLRKLIPDNDERKQFVDRLNQEVEAIKR